MTCNVSTPLAAMLYGAGVAPDVPPVVLAPMAGVSDAAFRFLCQEAGADLTYTEMVSALGLAHGNAATRELLKLGPAETRLAVQLFGHDPAAMARAVSIVEETLGDALALIDVNMGCSVRKIASKGDACALMRDVGLAAAVVAAMVAVANVPVTVKLRRGWSPATPSAVELARRLEDAGAAALTVHGRFGVDGFRGHSDWDTIAQVKAAVSLPVIGNGDIVEGVDALAMVQATGCDGVMIARGALGNPWLFTAANAALAGVAAPPSPSVAERLSMGRRHCELVAAWQPRHLLRMRTLAPCYLTGLPGASKARGALAACTTLEDFTAVFDALEARLSTHVDTFQGCEASGY